MTPKITAQTKILIKDKSLENTSWNSTKFAVINDPIPSVITYFLQYLIFNDIKLINGTIFIQNELGEWEDNAVGWEEETTKEFGDPTKTLREQKRREREQRLFEQQQKRIERSSRPQPLGAKLNSWWEGRIVAKICIENDNFSFNDVHAQIFFSL